MCMKVYIPTYISQLGIYTIYGHTTSIRLPVHSLVYWHVTIICAPFSLCMQEAEQSYLTAIQHRRKYPDAYYNLGNLVMRPFRTSQHACTSSAWFSDQDTAVIWRVHDYYTLQQLLLLISQYIDTGRPDDAIRAFKSAIAIESDHALSWTNLGLLLENLGIQQILVIDLSVSRPCKSPSTVRLLGTLYRATGRGRGSDEGGHDIDARELSLLLLTGSVARQEEPTEGDILRVCIHI